MHQLIFYTGEERYRFLLKQQIERISDKDPDRAYKIAELRKSLRNTLHPEVTKRYGN